MDASEFLVYLNIIRKRLWLIILLFIVTVGTVFFLSKKEKPVYRASVRLQVVASEPQEVALFSEFRAGATSQQLINAQTDFIRSLQSGVVAWQTIADLNLGIGAYDLLKSLSISTEGPFITVIVEADDPAIAEALATTHVENALQYYRATRARPSTVIREFISGQLAMEEKRLKEAKDKLRQFKLTHNLDSLEDEIAAYQDLIRRLQFQRDQATIVAEQAEVKAVKYRAEEEGASDAAAAALEQENTATAAYFRGMAQSYAISATNEEARALGARAEIKRLDELIKERSAELASLISLTEQYDVLRQDLAHAESNYNFLWSKENEALLKERQALNVGFIQIVEPARRPDSPAPSKMARLMLVAGVSSILGGVILAFILEFLSAVGRAMHEQARGKRR